MYKDFIKGKRVIFVGSCPNIKGRNQGEIIDSYEVVVKTNGSVFLEGEEYFKDYGSRIDVLYTNNQFQREMRPLPVKDFYKRGISYLRMKACSDSDLLKYNEYIKTGKITETMQQVNKKLYGALMGAYIFTDILLCEPRELFITGVDFFVSKKKVFEHDNYQEYLPGYLPDKIRRQGNIINKGKIEDGHNMLDNTKYIHELFHAYECMVMPDFIYELMIKVVNGLEVQE
jgi:hypothetical protein